MLKNPQHITMLATWFSAGTISRMPGTVGSLAALPVAYFLQLTFGTLVLLVATIVIFAIGVIVADAYSKHIQAEDPKEVVIDEVAGQWLVIAAGFPTWQSYLLAFILFRFFDILKPWPISLADKKIKGGFGIMFDDILAGLAGAGVLLALPYLCTLAGQPQLAENLNLWLMGQ